MIEITPTIVLDPREITETFIRSPGPGGQNVNIFCPINIKTIQRLSDL